MKRKYVWWTVVLLIAVAAGYGYFEYNRKRADSKKLEAKFTLRATDLIEEFAKNEAAANKKYSGQDIILEINGNIKDIVKDEHGYYTVLLGDAGSQSSVRCLMDTTYVQELSDLKKGNQVSLKGNFNGYKADDLGIGADVELNFCVWNK